jgi:hypothetical protein
MAESRKFAVGDTVRFRFGIRNVIGKVKEDRGPIGLKGRRLYSIGFTPDLTPEFVIELPAEDLELVLESGSPKE